jgi:uncharacterized protein DUF1918
MWPDASGETLPAMDASPNAQPVVGESIEIKGRPGMPARRGEILDVLGPPERRHYQVRWDDGHESLFYPDDSSHFLIHGERNE